MADTKKYLDQAGLQLVLSKLTNKYDQRFLGLHDTADAAQKTTHKLTINVRDEEARVFDGSQDFTIDVAKASHRHPATEVDYANAGMSGVANVNEALDVLVKNVQIASGVLSSTTANMNTLKDALDQEKADRAAADEAEAEARANADTGLGNRIKVLEDLLAGSGNVDEAIKDVLELLNQEIERSTNKDNAHDELLEDHGERLDVIEGEGEGSIKAAVKAEQERAVAKEGELDAAIKAEASRADAAEKALQKAISDEETARKEADNALSERITTNKNAIDLLNADENTEGSVAKDIKDAEARVKVVTDKLDGRMTGAEARLDVIEGEGEGSIRKAVADLVDGAPDTLDTLNELAAALRDDKDVLTAIETAFDGKLAAEKKAREDKEKLLDAEDARLDQAIKDEVTARDNAVKAEASAREAADNALDERIDEIEKLIGDEDMSLKDIREAIEANAAAIQTETTERKAADEAIQDQIDIIDGAADVEGSFRKAIADQAATQLAKDNAQDRRMDGIDTAIGVQGVDGAIGTGVHGRIDQEIATRTSEDARLEGRIGDIEKLIGGGEGSASLADLNGRLKTVEAEQIVQNQNIADNAAAIAAIVALEEKDIDAAFAAVFQ